MTNNVIIYHNPRCSKSREALKLLENKGIEPSIIKYLETPPDVNTLKRIIEMLNIEDPRDLMRKHESEYKENNLDNPSLSQDELIQAMVSHPRIIERPIVVSGNKAEIGRPPIKIIDIL